MFYLKIISLVPRMPRQNLHLIYIPGNDKERNVPPIKAVHSFMCKLFITLWLTLLKQSIKRLGNDCLRRIRSYKTLVKSVCETASKSLFWVLSVYQDVSTRHDRPELLSICQSRWWGIQTAFRVSPLGDQNKDIGSSSQTLLTEVKLPLRRRLGNDSFVVRTTTQPPCVLHCKWQTFCYKTPPPPKTRL